MLKEIFGTIDTSDSVVYKGFQEQVSIKNHLNNEKEWINIGKASEK